jgi:hypothetical protein
LVVEELERRRWGHKRWRTRRGQQRGGRPFTATSLHLLLTNVLYVGNIKHKNAVHAGEHAGIVAEPLWRDVQDLLRAQGKTKGALGRNRFGALLKGLLRCLPCGCAMTPTHATRNGKRYRYYVCSAAVKFGRHRCPGPSLAAPSLEQVVLEQLKDSAQVNASVQTLLGPGWQQLAPPEQARLLRVLIERVDYDGSAGTLAVALHAGGPQRLAEELRETQHDVVQNP